MLVAETVGEVSLNVLLKRWLAQTAEAVLVHDQQCWSVVENEEYLNPQNCTLMLGCLRTAWKHQY